MRAEVIGVGPAAAVMDDEPDVERVRLVGALPRLAEQARLVVGRQRRRLADVDVGRAQPQDRGDDGVEDVAGRHDEQAHRTTDAARPAPRPRRAAAARPASAPRRCNVRRRDVDAEQPDRHDDDVAIAAASGARPPREPARADCGPARARCPAGRPSGRATARRRAGGRTRRVSSATGAGTRCASDAGEPAATSAADRARSVAIAGASPSDNHRDQRPRRRAAPRRESPSGISRPPTRRFSGAWNGRVAGRRRRRRTSAAIFSTSVDGDRDRVGTRQPLHPAAADDHHEDRRGGRDVDGPRRRAEARVQRTPAAPTARPRSTAAAAAARRRPARRAPPAAAAARRPPTSASAIRSLAPRRVRPDAAPGRPAARSSRAPARPPARAARTGTCRHGRDGEREQRDVSSARAAQRLQARRRETRARRARAASPPPMAEAPARSRAGRRAPRRAGRQPVTVPAAAATASSGRRTGARTSADRPRP